MNNNWMTCTSCKAVVQLNATGTCLGCQGGFGCQSEEDRYLPVETKTQSNEELQKRKEPKAKRSNSPKRGRKKQETKNIEK